MRKFVIGAIAAVSTLASAAAANASNIASSNYIAQRIFYIDQISSSGIADQGTRLGSVTLKQNGNNQVDVSVNWTSKTTFVNTGNNDTSHTPFTFNLSLKDGTYAVTNLASPFEWTKVDSVDKPYGTFTDGILMPGVKNGSPGVAGPLNFSVYAASGINISNFVPVDSKYYFAADVLGPNGKTGAVAALPVPAALPLFASALAGVGLLARRRKAKSAE